MYYIYVLRTKNDGNFYIGFTNDLKLRFERHNKRLVEATKDRRPLELIDTERCFQEGGSNLI